jgi:hypothetical protein
MNIPRTELDEIEQIPEMAGRRSAIAFAIAKKYLVFAAVCAGFAWLFHTNGLSWGNAYSLAFCWLGSTTPSARLGGASRGFTTP